MASRTLQLPLKIFGVPVRLDYSFLLVLPLFAYLIGSQLPAYVERLEALGVPLDPSAFAGARAYALGLIGAIGLFTSVLIHEVGHALTARVYGIQTKEIRLWFLGGVAQFQEMPRQRGAEALVALAGPVTSALLALLLWGSMQLLSPDAPARVVLSYLAVTNLALALFNMLPALPLDGGRILRSLLALMMPRIAATDLAVGISGAIAIIMGVLALLGGQLYLALIAFFIYNAGRLESQATLISEAAYGRTVAEFMNRDVVFVAVDMPLAQFERMAEFRAFDAYPVVDHFDHFLGVARLARAHAPETFVTGTVADVLEAADTVSPSASVLGVLQQLTESPGGRLYVVDASGTLRGVLSKTDFVRHIREFVALQ